MMSTHSSLGEVSIGGLAKASGLSKSGLFAHFKSKDNLQVAVIEYASEIFEQRVIGPTTAEAMPALSALRRLKALIQHWLNWYDGKARSCIFIATTIEFEDQPGLVRDCIHLQMERWISYLQWSIDQVIAAGQFKQETQSKQLAFEIYSLYLGSHMYHWLGKEDKSRSQFQLGFDNLLERYLV